ncbi:MAG: antibiotic biosynthesis monooxygenase [Actinobacteria bacterium]|nr:antibiotic biosynthesis monooxygenase [Actinomycetota bacterium]
MIVEVAWYRARPGQAEAVVAAMREAIPPARDEPGCQAYLFHQSVEDPEAFLVYEQYVDEAAMDAHLETPHFREIVQGRVNPLLESREWKSYRLVEP